METARNYKQTFKLYGTSLLQGAPYTLDKLFERNSPLPEHPTQPKTALEQKVTNAAWEYAETQVAAVYETRTPLTGEEQHQLSLLTELELTSWGKTGAELEDLTSGRIYASTNGTTLEEVQMLDNDTAFADVIDALSTDDALEL